MKKSRKQKQAKKLLVSVDKVRPLQPEKLDNVAGGYADSPDPCQPTKPITTAN